MPGVPVKVDRELVRLAANALLGLGLSAHTDAIPEAQREALDIAAKLRRAYKDSR
jgi:hypothetical protein